MAKATLNKTKQPKLVEKVNNVKEVTLTLSENEAAAIMSLLYKTGGCPKTTPRKHLVKINQALYDAGIRYPDYCGETRDGMRYSPDSIYFTDKFPYTPEELA